MCYDLVGGKDMVIFSNYGCCVQIKLL